MLHRICPDCKLNERRSYRLTLRMVHRTAWYGVLRYFKCPNCREKYVVVGNGPAETAID